MEKHPVGYKALVNGRFTGVLRWPQFEQLWRAIDDEAAGWYVYEPEKSGPPETPLSVSDMKDFLTRTEAYLREGCTDSRCGAVYTDSLDQPQFIKIYNPRLMGGCGMGKAPLPEWLLSRVVPVSLIEGA